MRGNSVLPNPLAGLSARTPGGVSVLFPKGGTRLHAMVTSAGYDDCRDPAYDWHGLRRGEGPFVLVQHTLGGRGNLRFEGRDYDIGPGQTLLLRFPHDNRYWLGRHARWEFFWLCLSGREVLRLWREMLGVAGPVVALPGPVVDRLGELCAAVLDGQATSAARASEVAYAAAMTLADHILAPGKAQTGPARPGAVERAMSLCSTRASGPLDVARMADAAGLSRHHFSRVFAASEGVSPARYLLQQRMERAAGLLHTETAPIKEIAARCGFSDANYFAKVFRRIYAISPREYRSSGAYGTVRTRAS